MTRKPRPCPVERWVDSIDRGEGWSVADAVMALAFLAMATLFTACEWAAEAVTGDPAGG